MMAASDEINIGTVAGGNNQIGRGNTMNLGSAPAPAPAASWAPGTAQRPSQATGGSPVSTLYAFADIVGYSNFKARLQEESQDRLTKVLDRSLAEAGVGPDAVTPQDQGDARLLIFPADTDVVKVLAVMPRYLNGDLLARNEDLAAHARMRVRLSFTMGPATPGKTGMAGEAPITVVRLANSRVFRSAMATAEESNCGVIMDSYLYHGFVRQNFRPDMGAEEYFAVHVSEPEKSFEADAWIRIFGGSQSS
jgi:hypothetical protein